ncbi:4Fe-4S binding protein [uncultured Alistipes sp.]|jgi:4Fe-4S ferredoxin iron-sulfur binding domain protein|uniref:4Fe-4S binding protein n=1 Tax=uncultured Alistipes sp. TaxID=538949 RepID=UPI0025FE356D|nr:4Fe-4S binding protein [uncultured Alistipes sp.]
MRCKTNYLKHLLQWGVLAAIVGTVLWAKFSDKSIDVEAYCPFGGLQAFGTYLVNNSLACSMSMLQIMMGLVLAVGVILFSKLFCGYLCPLGTVEELMGRAGRKMHIQVDVRQGSMLDKLLRAVKYVLLFTILYFTLSSSELFCKKLDPFYAVATGFKGEIVLWMSMTSLALLILGGFVVRMFWCRYICPLGAVSNIFKFTLLFLAAALAAWGLSAMGVANGWIWSIGGACIGAYIVEIVKMRSCVFPLMYIKCDQERCISCGLCEKKCPYGIPVYDYVKVKHVDCTLCGSCIGSCSKDALQVNGRRAWRWMPGLLAVILFFAAIWLGSTMELPTIDEKWGEYDKVENLQTYEMEGLQTIKCYGSSKAFSSKMQAVPGVYGVKTFVRRHGVEVLYDPMRTDTLKIQEAIFAPTQRKYATPGEDVPALDVVKLGVEGLHDRMDMVYFGMVLQKVEGIYGFVAEFDCPVDVTVYADPGAGITEKQLEEAIEARELVIPVKDGEKVIPMHTVLKSCRIAGQVSREEFADVMFRDVAKLSGKFIANQEKWGDDVQFPKAVYEMVFPGIEKTVIRNSFPYFKSFLSCTDGIMSIEFVLRDLVPVMRIRYVGSMWNDEKIWKEIFGAEKWTIRMADGTFKEQAPRLKFTTSGQTVIE